MKEKEIMVDFPDHQAVYYAEKDDGSYGPLQTGAYASAHHLDEFHKFTDKLNNSLIEQLKNGEISPIYYYMNIEMLTVFELASRVKISRRRVKKHLGTEGFLKLSVSELKRYADVLNIRVANLFQIIDTKEDKKWYSGYKEKDDVMHPFFISQLPTKNPIIVETKIIDIPK
jgi:hypothetical protein